MLKNAFLTLFFLLCASSASFGGLSVFPQRIEKCIPPGGKGTGVYIITSDYSEPITVSVEARHWFTLKENKGIKIDDWYSISKREFVVGPGERMSIPYEVVVPTSAVGTLVGMVSFIPRDPGMQGISLLISVSIYVTVDGTQRLSWGIEKLEIKEKRLDYDRDVYAHVTNDGNVHIRPTGTAKITKGKKVIGETEFIYGNPVYPGNERSFIARGLPFETMKAGKYRLVVEMKEKENRRKKVLDFRKMKSGEIIIKEK